MTEIVVSGHAVPVEKLVHLSQLPFTPMMMYTLDDRTTPEGCIQHYTVYIGNWPPVVYEWYQSAKDVTILYLPVGGRDEHNT